MHATDANTDCLNYLTSVLMVSLQKQIQFTSFSGVIFMAPPVNRFVTSLPRMKTPWQPDMNRQWHDWSRYLVQDTSSKFSGRVI